MKRLYNTCRDSQTIAETCPCNRNMLCSLWCSSLFGARDLWTLYHTVYLLLFGMCKLILRFFFHCLLNLTFAWFGWYWFAWFSFFASRCVVNQDNPTWFNIIASLKRNLFHRCDLRATLPERFPVVQYYLLPSELSLWAPFHSSAPWSSTSFSFRQSSASLFVRIWSKAKDIRLGSLSRWIKRTGYMFAFLLRFNQPLSRRVVVSTEMKMTFGSINRKHDPRIKRNKKNL